MAADGYGRWFAEGHEKERRGHRSIHGGVPIGFGK